VAVAMLGIEYVTPALFTHVLASPVIVPAAVGTVVNDIVLEFDVPFPQVFVGVTCIAPAVVANETVMLFVFAPFVIVAPVGKDQL
jgi:hypothetical protein